MSFDDARRRGRLEIATAEYFIIRFGDLTGEDGRAQTLRWVHDPACPDRPMVMERVEPGWPFTLANQFTW